MNKRWFFRYQNSLSVLISTLALNKAFLIFLQYVKAQWVKCTITCAKKMSFFFFFLTLWRWELLDTVLFLFYFFLNPHLRIYLLILERDGGGKKEKETLISCLPYMPRTRDRTHNQSMCLDWEWDLQPFGVQDNAPAN